MTDDLRDRIAAVICGMDALHAKQWSLDVADVVIREMGLRLDSTCHIHDREGKQRCHRYVTEWTVSE